MHRTRARDHRMVIGFSVGSMLVVALVVAFLTVSGVPAEGQMQKPPTPVCTPTQWVTP